jgi:hypothetical protein
MYDESSFCSDLEYIHTWHVRLIVVHMYVTSWAKWSWSLEMAFFRTFGTMMLWCSFLIVVGVCRGIESWCCRKNKNNIDIRIFIFIVYKLMWTILSHFYSTVLHKVLCLPVKVLWLESVTNYSYRNYSYSEHIWTRNSLTTHHTCTITSETALHCLT